MEMGSIFVLYIQATIPTYIRTLLHYNLKLPDVYVGIVGWIYRTMECRIQWVKGLNIKYVDTTDSGGIVVGHEVLRSTNSPQHYPC